MIDKYLGEQIDIHGGGNDLIFPHHENEILQTEAVTGKPLANYWMHNGMLQVKGHGMTKEEKMSKSLGNFFTVKDVAAKYDPQTIRFYFLNTHYMSPLLYGEDMLEEAKAADSRIINNYKDLKSYVKNAPEGDADANDCCDVIEQYRQAFRDAMDDDFNTRQAIEVLFQMVRATNKAMNERSLCKKAAQKHIDLMDEFNGILNIIPADDSADDGIDDEMMDSGSSPFEAEDQLTLEMDRINDRLAKQRADVVVKALMNQYNISADRITFDSKGSRVQPFAENDLNRVTICIAE